MSAYILHKSKKKFKREKSLYSVNTYIPATTSFIDDQRILLYTIRKIIICKIMQSFYMNKN